MGWMRHHGIVVTSWSEEKLNAAHAKAVEVFGVGVTDTTEPVVNGYGSFLVAPDGSKEGWSDSDEGDARRDLFIRWLHSQAYEDGSSALDWIEYQHDVDGRKAAILQSSSERSGGEKHGS